MDNDQESRASLHSSGAIVRHNGKFAELEVPSAMELPDQPFLDKWVLPYYRWKIRQPEAFFSSYSSVQKEVTPDLCRTLLAICDWRPRVVGAYFSALEGFVELEDQIGRLFLRSDVCFAGRAFATVLAGFNTCSSIQFIEEYLDYYLTRKELNFDQAWAMAALEHIDRKNNTYKVERHLSAWNSFAGEKGFGNLGVAGVMLKVDLKSINRIRMLAAQK